MVLHLGLFISYEISLYRMKSALFKVKSTISDQKVLEMVFGLEVMAQLFCCRYVCECNLGCLNLKCTYGER